MSQLYVSRILDPVVGMFSDAVDACELVGDPQFLTNAFLHLVRATDMAPAHAGERCRWSGGGSEVLFELSSCAL